MNVPKCIKCQKPCWFDMARGTYSSYCGNTCRLGLAQPVQNHQPISRPVSQPIPIHRPTHAVQGQPICRMCSNAAFYDGYKFSPGCGRTHASEAIALGFTTPR